MYNDDFLEKKILQRVSENALRYLAPEQVGVDFFSNDYLGIATQKLLQIPASEYGSGGSRLLAGNRARTQAVEHDIARFHSAEASLLFNSGYDANIGLLSCVPQRGDVVFYDALCHASIRDGLRLGFAQCISFEHNNCEHLNSLLKSETTQKAATVFIVTEAVFSMDGDLAPLKNLLAIGQEFGAHIIVDEAHSIGVVGQLGEGLCQYLGIEAEIFARIYTYGKALGCHGAAVVGSQRLATYLLNFARSFIYTTALPLHAVEVISAAYALMPTLQKERQMLEQWIGLFQKKLGGFTSLAQSSTAIQAVFFTPEKLVLASQVLQQCGFLVKPIRYPTVPRNTERIRIILHSFNTDTEVNALVDALVPFLKP